MTRKNIALFDSTHKEAEDFLRGLESATQQPWEGLVCTANQGRKRKLHNLLRYLKYFLFPAKIFLNRRKYGCIIGWQAFYALIFAFYCRLFRVKKTNTLLVKNLTYKPKKGVIGKLYFAFMRYIVKSGYVDIFVCSSRSHCDYCAEVFGEPRDRFVFLPFGVNDFTKLVSTANENGGYILSLGRSNRDWNFLINALDGCEYPVRIVCDELHREELPENIRIYNNVWQERSYEFIRDCAIMVIPILDGSISAGETVLLQAMSFGKPVIVARTGGWAEYIADGETGFVIPKEKEALLVAARRLLGDRARYDIISKNCRRVYETEYSLWRYGQRVGELLKERKLWKN